MQTKALQSPKSQLSTRCPVLGRHIAAREPWDSNFPNIFLTGPTHIRQEQLSLFQPFQAGQRLLLLPFPSFFLFLFSSFSFFIFSSFLSRQKARRTKLFICITIIIFNQLIILPITLLSYTHHIIKIATVIISYNSNDL